ncbi:nuclear transport factor 2 family protein [Sphingobacteriales bacterium UPWRP_1]|nr:hypothetical protein BVG80_12585 [Sphingobacteriales bacterium TSM_CSM]PSJ77864.1 nuclear transport factor 2 family protein [Sphingobacteriales bacterium UPWRP_1]
MSSKLETVQQIYACFAQGDIPGIIAKLADDVTFYNDANPQITPWGGTFRGKDGVMQFFRNLGANSQTTHFEPFNFREEGGKIMNEVRHDGIITTTGNPFSVTVLFTWSFNNAGEVTGWEGTGDFSGIDNAF